ncbi:MAG: hypothetical protein ACR2JB_30575 [Bryobacteraceae bacterium]
MQLDQRAWISVRNAPKITLDIGKPVLIEVYFANTGKTPALDLIMTEQLVSQPQPLGKPFETGGGSLFNTVTR